MKSLLEKLIVLVLAVTVFTVVYASDEYFTGSDFKLSSLLTGAIWLIEFDSTNYPDSIVTATSWTNGIYLYDSSKADGYDEYYDEMLLGITLTHLGYDGLTLDSGNIVFELYSSATDSPFTKLRLMKKDSMLDPSVNDTIWWWIRSLDSMVGEYLAMKCIYTDSAYAEATTVAHYDSIGLGFNLWLKDTD